jgi:hypothetical protein
MSQQLPEIQANIEGDTVLLAKLKPAICHYPSTRRGRVSVLMPHSARVRSTIAIAIRIPETASPLLAGYS